MWYVTAPYFLNYLNRLPQRTEMGRQWKIGKKLVCNSRSQIGVSRDYDTSKWNKTSGIRNKGKFMNSIFVCHAEEGGNPNKSHISLIFSNVESKNEM